MSDVLHERSILQETKSEATSPPAALTTILPKANLLTVVVSLGVLVICAGAFGYLWQRLRWVSNDSGEGPLLAVVSLIPGWVAWQQWRGTFRRHERAANEAGNWLIGVAAILATCLAALPMMAATPLTLDWLLALGGWIAWSAVSGYCNLVWARQLRFAGWNEDEHGSRRLGSQFSLADLLVWMLLAAGATATFAHFDREERLRRQPPGRFQAITEGLGPEMRGGS